MTPEQQKAIALANARKRKAEAMGGAPAAPPMSTRETERFPPQEGLGNMSMPAPYPQRAGDLQGVRDYLSQSQAEDDARAVEREALRKRAAEAGRAETLRGLQSTSPIAMGVGGPSATLAGQAASDQVYDQAGVMSPEAATEVRGFNSALFGLPGLLNESARERIGQAGQDQPGAALLGDVAGYLVPGELAWQAGKGLTNAFARPIVSRIMPQGGSALARGTRFTGRYGTQAGAWAGQNALYQGTVGESVAAAEEGRAPSLGSAAERAGEGATDPLNALGPAALMGLNRLREFATTGGRSATPRSVAESVAANRGAPTAGSFLDAGRLGGGDVDRRAETLLIRMLRNAGYSGDDIRRGLSAFDTLAEQTSDLPVLASRLKDVLIDQLGPRAEQVVQDFLQGAGVSRGGTAGQAVADAAQQDYGRLSDFLEASANARLGQGSRFDTLTAAQDEMTRIGNEGYERVFGAAPTNQEGVADLRQALDFYANSELATPLRQVAAGRMLNVEQMIEADPRRAAHWMQHTAGLRAQEAADAGNEVLARAYTDMRQQILRRLEADGVAPGYQQARMQFGDQFGIEQAVNFGSRFFTRVQDSVGVRQLAEDIRNLTPQQQEAALLSIRDELLRLAGRGREGAAPRLSQLNTESALGGLETVVGERGGQLANDIRFIDERLARIRRTDPTANSRTATNTEAREFADRAVSNPITRTIGNAINAIGGDAALASVASGGTVPPVFSIRAGMRAMGDRMARGRQGKIDDVTALLLRDYGNVPRPGMPGDAMPPLTSRGGPTGGGAPQVENAFAQTMSNQQTVPSQNAFRGNEAGSVSADVASGLAYGSIGGVSGGFVDYNQDGVNDWQDMAVGAGVGFGGGAILNRAGEEALKRLPKKPAASTGSGQRLEDLVDAEIQNLRPASGKLTPATAQDWQKATSQATQIMKRLREGSIDGEASLNLRRMANETDPNAKPIALREELTAAILRSAGIDPDPYFMPMVAKRATNAEGEESLKKSRMLLGSIVDNMAQASGKSVDELAQPVSRAATEAEYQDAWRLARQKLMRDRGQTANIDRQTIEETAVSILRGRGLDGSSFRVTGEGQADNVIGIRPGNSSDPKQFGPGNAFAQSLMGGAGGSAYGSQNDINGDGVIDEQDVFLGSAAGTVGLPLAMGVAGRVGNAFAPGARSMGAGGPKTPQQSMRAELPGSPILTAGLGGGAGPKIPARGYDELRIGQASVEVTRVGDGITINRLKVPENARGQGEASKALQEVLRQADAEGLTVYLTADPVGSGGLSKPQLEAFYKRNGFVPNKGRNKDFSSTAGMIRPPRQTQTMGLGGGGRKPPPDSPEAIKEAVRGIARQTPATPSDAPLVAPRGQMRGVLQAPERVPPASPMADQVPPPLPPRPPSAYIPSSGAPNAREIVMMAGTAGALGGTYLMEKANDPATFGLASFDELPEGHPLRDPNYRRMALMAQMQPQPQRANAFAQVHQ